MQGIYFSNPITQVVLRGEILYLVSSQENAIHVYHISGLPLNAYTLRYGQTMPLKHAYIDTPVHLAFHSEEDTSENKYKMYICNYHTGVIAFDTRNLHEIIPMAYSSTTPYMDETALHMNPKQLAVNENTKRLAVLYENPSQVRLYQYDGSFLQNILQESFASPPQQITAMGEYFYILQQSAISKMDKNGLPIQFWGEEYDREASTLTLPIQSLYLTASAPRLQCLHTDLTIREYGCAEAFTTQTITMAEGWIVGHHPQAGFFYYSPRTKRLWWDTVPSQMAISYHPFSNFIPTTNLQVIHFLTSRKTVYQSLTQAFQNAMTYLNQNKQFMYAYHDWHQERSIVLPAHELIMVIQEKFLLPLPQWRVDPFIQRYEQHFPESKYLYYQRKRKLYLQILQTYYEATIYEKLVNDVKKIIDYDDYLNKESPMKMDFEIDRTLFPRVPEEEVRRFYTKDQAKVFRGWIIGTNPSSSAGRW
jgi:hypothetical protein